MGNGDRGPCGLNWSIMLPIILRKIKDRDCGKQECHEQHDGQGENARMEAFLSQDFLVGLEVGEWVHGFGRSWITSLGAPAGEFEDAAKADGVVGVSAFAVATQAAELAPAFPGLWWRSRCGSGLRRSEDLPGASASRASAPGTQYAWLWLRWRQRIRGAG